METLGGILDKSREQELALASQKLPEEEYWKKIMENNYKKQKDMADAIKNAGAPVEYFHKWLEKDELEKTKAALEAEKEGKVQSFARVETESEQKAKQETLKKERGDISKQVQSAYGDEGLEEIEKIYKEYEGKILELSQTPMSDAERRLKEMEVRQQYNKKISDSLKTPEMRQAAVKQGVNNALESIYKQSPALAQDPQTKYNFEEQARPVLENAMREIVEIQNDEKLTADEKQKKINKIEAELSTQISDIGQSAH